jgi:hypothetical protein
MNNDIIYAIPIGICILLAMYFLINWYVTYSGIKRMGISTIINEGMSGLSYINKENPDFSEDEARKLNRFRRLIYVFMVLGIAIIILNMVLR